MDSPKYRIALVTGFPNDVAWYEEGMTPKYSLLVKNNKYVYWNGYENKDQAVATAKAIETGTENSMSNLECIIEFPLAKGKKYDVEDPTRPDTMYAWYVEEVDRVRIKVKGHKSRRPEARFRLIYRTPPGHTIMELFQALALRGTFMSITVQLHSRICI